MIFYHTTKPVGRDTFGMC